MDVRPWGLRFLSYHHQTRQPLNSPTNQTVPPAGFTVRVMRGDEVEAVAQICADAFGEQNKITGCVPVALFPRACLASG